MEKESVLILGASSDVAKEIAYAYADKKYNLILAGPDLSNIDNLCKDISIRNQVKCAAICLDVMEKKDHSKVIDNLTEMPDTTICLIGYLGDHEKAKTSWEETNRILDINFNGVVSILNLIATKYESKKKGKIAVFSSVAGDRGRQSNYYYGSAKAALTAYLSGLRNRLHPYGVHVLTIKPGFIATKMTENMDLPGILTASPKQVAMSTVKAIEGNKNVIYTRWFWRYIMLIILLIPEAVFKKLKL